MAEVAQIRLSSILDESELTKKEIQEVSRNFELLQRLTAQQAAGDSDYIIMGGKLVNATAQRIGEVEEQLKEYTDLVTFIEITGLEGADAILNAIQSNVASLETFQAQSGEFAGGVANAMEEATQSVLEFNNAREELFYGMAASNITGDLVRQVVNRGVENLLVNTEVIMTNNFNGMTTEQAAQEILDHVERGARMRGVDMTTTSQSI